MSTDLESEIENELKESDNILLSLHPVHRFYIILVFVIGVLLLGAFFMYINQDNPEIQKRNFRTFSWGSWRGSWRVYGCENKS